MCVAGDRDPSNADHNVAACVTAANDEQPPKRKRGGGKANRISSVPEDVVDLGHAIRELMEVRKEIAALPNNLRKPDRDAALIEPMSRVQLVMKFCEAVLRHNGWKRQEAK